MLAKPLFPNLLRYLFVFHLKNPTGAQEDFWKYFIVLWTFALSFGTNAVFFFLTVDNQGLYHLCVGKFPTSFKNSIPNIPLVVIMVFTITLHSFVAIRYRIYEYKGKIRNPQILTEHQNIICLNFNKMSIVNFATNCAGVFYLSLVSYVPLKVNGTDPIHFNIYPEYLWIYVLNFYLTPINQIFVILVLTTKNAPLRKFIRREISESLKICQ